MPINMPSFVHGQGYADANFLIPELFSIVDVRKGPYFADEGVFASAGAVHMQYIDKLARRVALSAQAAVLPGVVCSAQNPGDCGDGELFAAIEGNIYNGPWEWPDKERKVNGVVRWSQGTQDNGISLTAMAYSNHWMATDQIAQRAVTEGALSRWGMKIRSDGGNASRYSLSARWSQADNYTASRVEGLHYSQHGQSVRHHHLFSEKSDSRAIKSINSTADPFTV